MIVLSLLVGSVSVAQADDASKMAKVQEFFKLAKIDQLSAQSLKQASEVVNVKMIQSLSGVKAGPEQQQITKDFSAKVVEILAGALSWDKVEPEVAKVYADSFTERQLDDLIAFYRSPAGQALVEKSPMLLKQMSAIKQQRLKSVMPQLQQAIKDFAAQEEATTSK